MLRVGRCLQPARTSDRSDTRSEEGFTRHPLTGGDSYLRKSWMLVADWKATAPSESFDPGVSLHPGSRRRDKGLATRPEAVKMRLAWKPALLPR